MSKTYYLPQSNEIELFEAAAGMNLPVLIKGPTGCGPVNLISGFCIEFAGSGHLNRKIALFYRGNYLFALVVLSKDKISNDRQKKNRGGQINVLFSGHVESD